MPVPSQGHYGFHSFPVVDRFCLFIYLWVLTFPLLDCSEFGNFVITLIYYTSQHLHHVHFVEYIYIVSSLFVCLMVFNATFNNILVISWRSVLLVVEAGGPGENHWPIASHWQTLSHNVVHLALIEIPTHSISGDRYWSHM
jgi:hypothetical protein